MENSNSNNTGMEKTNKGKSDSCTSGTCKKDMSDEGKQPKESDSNDDPKKEYYHCD